MAQLDQEDLHPRLIIGNRAAATGCEQYRTLRTQGFFTPQKRRLAQVIVVTSATEGEAKPRSAHLGVCHRAVEREARAGD